MKHLKKWIIVFGAVLLSFTPVYASSESGSVVVIEESEKNGTDQGNEPVELTQNDENILDETTSSEDVDVPSDISEPETSETPDNEEIVFYGLHEIEGKWYYFDESTGEMITGEKKIEGKWYYFDDVTGAMIINEFVDLVGKTVYYGQDGAMLYGEQNIGEKLYYFNIKTGAMAINEFIVLPDKTVYYGSDGVMIRNGEYKINGKWYYFDKSTGEMVKGFTELPDKTVYYGNNGAMCYGEQKIGGKWYYFNTKTGAMTTNSFVKLSGKTVYYGTDGAMRYGEQKINGKWYYFNTKTGAMTTGFVKLPTKTVYYGSDGVMRYGEQKINGKWYYFNTKTGAMATGFVKLPTKTVYYGSDGTMRYGEQTINGKIYYFNTTTGAMIDNAGWVKVNGTWCYFDKNTGKQLFKSNILHTAWNKAQSMSSSSKYIIIVDRANCRTMIFTGSKGNWVPLYDWACSPGKSSTPTISGTYTVGIKGYSFGTSSYTCYYYTQIKGNYLFHSILYKAGTFNVKDGRLGQRLSHGCVRLALANAKWMYNNIPRSTKIYIY